MHLQLSNIHYTFSDHTNVINDLHLTIEKGEFVSLIGPSGCGKSTLFNLISGLEIPNAGEILLNGHSIVGQRNHASYMMQKDLLLPWKTVLENALLGAEISKQNLAESKKKAFELLPLFGLEGYEHYYPHVLSGGMKQRAALLRTFLHQKEMLLLDEPFGALDALTREHMHEWLLSVWNKLRRSVLFITHSIDEAIFLSDRICVLAPKPTNIIAEYNVTLPRPRNKEMVLTEEYISLKKQLMQSLQ
ncbi:ABC transporter ATP-binding protein [Halalkalibacter hemicellulosilyticus]|uniref:Hydroxymethylpyrimidine ABC transporter n=1 Tax=Halalkalibacter hemicellulosilyticusJCM 9152 TaxID=1236971 RepID=W4QGV8_9BACI|nr:ABC transporter ATP-binding protein [Halalkalibacter hemicellulosilyticus]GAE30564.1 hydroxymethylpyrimidine ABC transporter [Halalkalibacter hemicellulosilyticusJCM 9152]